MTDTIRQIAARLLDTREALGKSPEEVAKTVGVPVAVYLRYESGEQDIPIGFLTSFGEAYDIPLASLITGEQPKLTAYTFTPHGKGLHVQRYPGYEYMALAHKFIDKKCEPFHVTVMPEAGEVQTNAHSGHEFDYVLEGKLRVTIGAKSLDLEAGDSVYFDSASMHGMQALDNAPAKFLAIVMK